MKNYRQLRDAESGKNIILQWRLHKIVTRWHVVMPENIYRDNIIEIYHYIWNLHIYIYICM